MHVTNGAIDDEAECKDEAFALARRFLSYLPTSVDDLPPRADSDDDPERREEALLSIVPRNPRHVYKMRHIIEAIVRELKLGKIRSAPTSSSITRRIT